MSSGRLIGPIRSHPAHGVFQEGAAFAESAQHVVPLADGEGPSSNAVSDADCGDAHPGLAGFVADASASASACVSTTCDVAGAADDRVACCAATFPLTLTDYTALVRRHTARQIHSV